MRCRTFLLAGAALFSAENCAAAAAQQTTPAPSPTATQPAPAAPQTAPASNEAPAPATAAQPAASSASQPASQAPAPDITDEYGDQSDSAPIVVTGSKPRGSAIGDIPPEQTLDSRDIQATGATSIDELLTALAPQIGSTQGRGGEQPVLLLNGQRISGFQELRDIPTEAIERVDILPEEEALKYGYSADQKVVNIVLRRFFRSTTASATGQVATEGGYTSETGDVTRLMIGRNGRTSVTLHAQGNGMLTEAQRDIALQPLPGTSDATDQQQQLDARSLIGSKRDVRAAAVVNRTILGDVAATVNTELEHNEGQSLFGISDFDASVLRRNTTTDTAHVAAVLNWGTNWRWSSTENADYSQNISNSDSRTSLLQDRGSSIQESAGADLTAHGNLFTLPGGEVGTTARVAASTLHMHASRTGPDLGDNEHSLNRTAGTASVNFDAPVSHRGAAFSALGNLTLNANAQVQQLSDFGTLTKIGGGVNWSPVDRLELIGSWNREEGAPTVDQLGDPLLSTPETRIFDFVTGQTVLATVITGGNPALLSDRRNVLKLSGNWQPFSKIDLRLRAEYTQQHIDHPISDLPGPTPAIEAAFPDRFTYGQVCDTNGQNCHQQLISADLRPVNYDSSQRNQLTIGFDFTHQLKSAPPSAATIAAFRQRMAAAGMPVPQQGGGSQQQGGSQASGSTSGGRGPGGGGGGGGFRGGGGRGGGFFGGRNGGRVMFTLTDTITFVDKVAIRPGLGLDYLHGDAIGQTGGQPRHDVQARANYFNNGLGAQLVGNWRSGTEVNTATGDNLHFSPYSTFDLRLFDNLGQQPDVVIKHPWLRGASVRFEVTNIFNAKPSVHNAMGQVPFSYQPNLLEPLGRTISITFRKLFLPSPSWFRQQYQRERQQQGGSTGS
jgi:hypothetical protein